MCPEREGPLPLQLVQIAGARVLTYCSTIFVSSQGQAAAWCAAAHPRPWTAAGGGAGADSHPLTQCRFGRPAKRAAGVAAAASRQVATADSSTREQTFWPAATAAHPHTRAVIWADAPRCPSTPRARAGRGPPPWAPNACCAAGPSRASAVRSRYCVALRRRAPRTRTRARPTDVARRSRSVRPPASLSRVVQVGRSRAAARSTCPAQAEPAHCWNRTGFAACRLARLPPACGHNPAAVRRQTLSLALCVTIKRAWASAERGEKTGGPQNVIEWHFSRGRL